MATPTIAPATDAEVRLMRMLHEDEEAGPILRGLVEKVAPGAQQRAVIKETVSSVAQARAELEAERVKVRQERDAERAQAEREREHDKLRAQGFTDADIPEIEKSMRERYIGNYPDAAALYRQSRQVAAPRTVSLSTEVPGVGGAGGDWFKGIVESAKAGGGVAQEWRRRKTEEIMTDFANGRGHLHG